MFYSRVLDLCAKKGISPTKLMLDLGMGRSNVTTWKSGSIPQKNTVKKVAEYFGVTTDFLLAKQVVIKDDTIDEQTRKIINDPDLHQYILMGIKAKEKGLSPEVLSKIIELYTK